MCLLARAARQGTIGAPGAVDFAEACTTGRFYEGRTTPCTTRRRRDGSGRVVVASWWPTGVPSVGPVRQRLAVAVTGSDNPCDQDAGSEITGAMGDRVEVIRTKGWVMQSQPAGVGINRATEITLSKMHGKIIDTQQIQTQGVDVDRLEALKVALDAGADDPDCQKIVLKLRDDPPTGNE